MNINSSPLYSFPECIQTRWATRENEKGERSGSCRSNDGRKRSPLITLYKGDIHTLAEVSETSGTVRRIWVTSEPRSPKILRGLRIDMYWDGAQTPAVSAPLGDFFCQGLGRMVPFDNALFSSPEGRSLNCIVPMPFLTGMKIVVTNETDEDVAMFFYEVDYTIGDPHKPGTLYFHTHWRRENPTTLRRDFEILPQVQGHGRFLGVNMSVLANIAVYSKSWWGEGEVKMFLDGDTDFPTLCGTGTEDYIGTGWGQKQSADTYQGCPVADADKFQYAFYRLHVPDPVYFKKDIRVTIQQIGCFGPWCAEACEAMISSGIQLFWGDEAVDIAAKVAAKKSYLFERHDDWSSCAYFYLNKSESNLPSLAPIAERIAGVLR